MVRCLVTGGAGFIGTNLCEELVRKGHEVIAIDNLSVSDCNLPHLKQLGVKLIVADIADYQAIKPHFKGVDVVYHLAAMNRAVRSIEQPIQAHHSNITGTLHVLEAMKEHEVPLIIFSSSSSVYAGRQGLLKEDDHLSPPHPYGVGKLAGEHYIRIYKEIFGINYVILRYFSVYGPRQLGHIDKAGVVAKFIHLAKNNKPLTIYGSGKQKRNFTYVQDVVRCTIKASETPIAHGHIINVANPEEITVNQLAQTIIEHTKSKTKIIYTDPIPTEPERNPADVSKLQDILDFYPKTTYEEGIKKTIRWYEQK